MLRDNLVGLIERALFALLLLIDRHVDASTKKISTQFLKWGPNPRGFEHHKNESLFQLVTGFFEVILNEQGVRLEDQAHSIPSQIAMTLTIIYCLSIKPVYFK